VFDGRQEIMDKIHAAILSAITRSV